MVSNILLKEKKNSVGGERKANGKEQNVKFVPKNKRIKCQIHKRRKTRLSSGNTE